ncbi:putative disease resistance protein [Hibiscus syriacus]|uniref:Disease resistance protein n=2 Tax=Hibiscus syriacus TaxID=106335 RepID=A0A6A3A7R7_HIBSY|nr:putative disease resistance protein [Hibiscus syriacus]
MLKKTGKYVLILDDVWDRFCLEEVGIPESSSSNGWKLVLTTRSVHVCKRMGCKDILAIPLSEEEALILFLNKVGPNIVQSASIMPILKLVVNECACLPLTIVVVAGTLKGEDDPCIWRNALKELKERIGMIEGAEAEVIERLKFSFDHIKDEKVKRCFLYCALYPEDFKIEKDDLIECWIDEGFIEEMDKKRNERHGLCLFEKVGRKLFVRKCYQTIQSALCEDA